MLLQVKQNHNNANAASEHALEIANTVPENIARMQKLGITNLPSILINGELKYSSIIPSHRELLEVVSAHLRAG